MRSLLPALLVLSTTTAAAQSNAQPAVLPDSSYLLLTLELPVHGTFNVTRTASQRSRDASTLVRRITHVEIQSCVMQWRLVQHTIGARGFGLITDVTVPLKDIDASTIEARPAPMKALERLEPMPWQLVGFALKDKKSAIVSKNPDAGTVTRNRSFEILVNEETSARRFEAALKDAAARCDTWRTSPMPVIR